MFVLYLIVILILMLIILICLLQLTVRLRFVFGPKEKSFRWQVSLLKNTIRKEFDFFPEQAIKKQVKKRGRENMVQLSKTVLRYMNFWQLEAYALLGLGDAAATAICCGILDAALNALGCALLPRGRRGRGWLLRTMPSFGATTFELQAHGIFRIRGIRIILALIKWLKSRSNGSA